MVAPNHFERNTVEQSALIRSVQVEGGEDVEEAAGAPKQANDKDQRSLYSPYDGMLAHVLKRGARV